MLGHLLRQANATTVQKFVQERGAPWQHAEAASRLVPIDNGKEKNNILLVLHTLLIL